MRDGFQVILHRLEAGSFLCEGFTDLAIARPVQIVVEGVSPFDDGLAQQLGRALSSAIPRIHSRATSQSIPCPELFPGPGFWHAFDAPERLTLFVLVGDGTRAVHSGHPIVRAASRAQLHKVIVLLPRGAPPSLLGDLAQHQAGFYARKPTEAVSEILAVAGIISDDRRIFISYQRREALGLAEQLFDALGREGFEVFLDSFSIPPGVDFQSRLHQELADKALVLVLESRHLSRSQWVTKELAFARARRLGLLALHLPFGSRRPEIDDEFRFPARLTMLRGLGHRKTLWGGALSELVGWISMKHARFLIRRRDRLQDAMQKAFRLRGMSSYLNRDGLLEVAWGVTTYRFCLTPRIPETGDFHRTHQAGGYPSDVGVVIGPTVIWNPEQSELLAWLARVSGVRRFDEGRLRRVVERIQQGGL